MSYADDKKQSISPGGQPTTAASGFSLSQNTISSHCLTLLRNSHQSSTLGALSRPEFAMPSQHRRNMSLVPGAAAPDTEEILLRAIEQHEQLDLQASTENFRRAADLGSSVAMCMYGIALRSGWGCAPDPQLAFEYICRAADSSRKRVEAGVDSDAAIHELAVALYEVAQSLRNGWGVKKSRRKGAIFLRMAAELGDSDSQVDVATAYLDGDGVKRDKIVAARYFRQASLAGQELPSNSWIWKPKYDACGVTRDSVNTNQVKVLPNDFETNLPYPLIKLREE